MLQTVSRAEGTAFDLRNPRMDSPRQSQVIEEEDLSDDSSDDTLDEDFDEDEDDDDGGTNQHFPFEVGKGYMFLYPEHPFYGIISTLKRRQIVVKRIRDLRQTPLTELEFQIQPLLIRGRWIVIPEGVDNDDEHETTWFYMRNMSDVHVLAPVQKSE